MTIWFVCDKCHKNIATHESVIEERRCEELNLTFKVKMHLCDKCAGVEPPKSVTKSSQTGDKITTYYNKEAMTNPVTSTTYTDKQEGQKQ